MIAALDKILIKTETGTGRRKQNRSAAKAFQLVKSRLYRFFQRFGLNVFKSRPADKLPQNAGNFRTGLIQSDYRFYPLVVFYRFRIVAIILLVVLPAGNQNQIAVKTCLLYTSDAADD